MSRRQQRRPTLQEGGGSPHLGHVQKVDLQEETQGASRDLIGRSADGVAYLAADRQPVLVLALGEDKKRWETCRDRLSLEASKAID